MHTPTPKRLPLARATHLVRHSPGRFDPVAPRVEAMKTACEAALVAAARRPFMGIDFHALCGGATRVEFVDLANDDKVRVVPGAVQLHGDCVRALEASRESTADAGALCALYLIHELVHLPQGIGPYRLVGHLRALGEDALLDFDLGADHVSALVLADMHKVGIEVIKTLQLRGLCAFPVTSAHTPEARRRKARRVVGLVAEAMLGFATDDRYLMADFAPTAREFALLSRGAGPSRLVTAATLPAASISRLLSAADPPEAGGASPGELATLLATTLDVRAA